MLGLFAAAVVLAGMALDTAPSSQSSNVKEIINYSRENYPSADGTVPVRIDHVLYGKDGIVECGITLKNKSKLRLYVAEGLLGSSIAGGLRFWRVDSNDVYRIRDLPGVTRDFRMHTIEFEPDQEITRTYRIETLARQEQGVTLQDRELALSSRGEFGGKPDTSAERLPPGKYAVTLTAKIIALTRPDDWAGPIYAFSSDSMNIFWCSVAE